MGPAKLWPASVTCGTGGADAAGCVVVPLTPLPRSGCWPGAPVGPAVICGWAGPVIGAAERPVAALIMAMIWVNCESERAPRVAMALVMLPVMAAWRPVTAAAWLVRTSSKPVSISEDWAARASCMACLSEVVRVSRSSRRFVMVCISGVLTCVAWPPAAGVVHAAPRSPFVGCGAAGAAPAVGLAAASFALPQRVSEG